MIFDQAMSTCGSIVSLLKVVDPYSVLGTKIRRPSMVGIINIGTSVAFPC
jgi:hypothetical protein